MAKGLTRERIVAAAADVADRDGIARVSMRSVGRELGVEAMSLYHHVASKEALLDALGDWLMAQVEPPPLDVPWRDGIRTRCASLRAVMARHPWGPAIVESRRAAGETLLGHLEAVLECLHRGGFPVQLAAHAFSVLDAYVYGFVITEQSLPFEPGGGVDELAQQMALPADRFPRMVALIEQAIVGRGYDYGDEFAYGLELVLDGLESRLAASRAGR
ncbi:TetR/AcrR family transcriptional regulator [Agrococcus sp. HG114]|uniref:TetR/AcrR family transcriptional regulator n=1 Tax=Agrococcus sp. HG114 TaxID=2969757 RepID=UPI00215B22B2|nr:TetR/AcrR family transcriptional regulator [Agrococcus sp. HG114]MCR8669825.1 TetR/AcrR family transcriptional regulator [Agrococcus sp. HG114]